MSRKTVPYDSKLNRLVGLNTFKTVEIEETLLVDGDLVVGGSISGGGDGGNSVFPDSAFVVHKSDDETAEIKFDASAVGTGTTVTLTAPSANMAEH